MIIPINFLTSVLKRLFCISKSEDFLVVRSQKSNATYGVALLLLVIDCISSCGPSRLTPKKINGVSFHLENEATNAPKNSLVFKAPHGSKYSFSFEGEGIQSELSQREFHPLVTNVALQVPNVGHYELKVKLAQSDGTLFLEDNLVWDYDLAVPTSPIVAFSQPGTNTAKAMLLTAGNRGPMVQTLWVEGDLAASDHPEGSWHDIGLDDRVPVNLSEGDGLKTVLVKYGNKFGNAGPSQRITTIRRSRPPDVCAASILSTTTRSDEFMVKIDVDDDQPMFVDVRGDVTDFIRNQRFTRSFRIPVHLVNSQGKKNLTVLIHDIGGNFCPRQDFEINLNHDYIPSFVRVKNGTSWTDNPEVDLQLHYDHFAEDPIEMFISGGVVESDETFRWLPYREELGVRLTSESGHRNIFVKFRTVDGKESDLHYTAVYLRPFLLLSGHSSPYKLFFSNMNGLLAVTVTGCEEAYVRGPLVQNLICTPHGESISATYELVDGSVFTRTAEIPNDADIP